MADSYILEKKYTLEDLDEQPWLKEVNELQIKLVQIKEDYAKAFSTLDSNMEQWNTLVEGSPWYHDSDLYLISERVIGNMEDLIRRMDSESKAFMTCASKLLTMLEGDKKKVDIAEGRGGTRKKGKKYSLPPQLKGLDVEEMEATKFLRENP